MLDLEKYQLLQYALEVNAYGVTVIPPEVMGVGDDYVERLRNAILRTCEKRNGLEIGDPSTCRMRFSVLNQRIWNLLKEDEVFIEAATNPSALAMVRWLLGNSAMLSGNNWIVKPPNREGLDLHSDAHGIPPGGGHIAHAANFSWLCTDYTGPEDGPTVFVPGSHHYGRVTLVQTYMRMHMRPIQPWSVEDFSPELRAKYPELERLLTPHMYPWEDEHDHPERQAPFILTGTDPFA